MIIDTAGGVLRERSCYRIAMCWLGWRTVGGWVPEASESAPGNRTYLETPAPPAPSSTCAGGREGGREGGRKARRNKLRQGAGRLWKLNKAQQRGKCSYGVRRGCGLRLRAREMLCRRCGGPRGGPGRSVDTYYGHRSVPHSAATRTPGLAQRARRSTAGHEHDKGRRGWATVRWQSGWHNSPQNLIPVA